MRLRPRTKFFEIGNAEFCHLRLLGKLAMEKAIQVDQVVISPRSEKIVNKFTKALLILGGAYFGIHILLALLRG